MQCKGGEAHKNSIGIVKESFALKVSFAKRYVKVALLVQPVLHLATFEV